MEFDLFDKVLMGILFGLIFLYYGVFSVIAYFRQEREERMVGEKELITLYTRDEAERIFDIIEEVYDNYKRPDPDEYDGNTLTCDEGFGLEGEIYHDFCYDALDRIEDVLIAMLEKHNECWNVVEGKFSGDY